MKELKTYFEELATPASTMGMGNPGEIAQDTLTEPIGTAKSEVEKDKKKRKKKIKSLSESLFDQDLTKKGVVYNEILEIDAWEPEDLKDGETMEKSIDCSFDRLKLRSVLNKWKKFLSPIKDRDVDFNRNAEYVKYWGETWFIYFSWIILCCSSEKEIKTKLIEFIKDIKTDRSKLIGKYPYYIKDIEIFPLEGFGEMKGFPRMVVIKVYTEDPSKSYMVHVALKKRA